MSEHFLRNIHIKKFKCFSDFEASGFGRVNLIGGKNNVGKTAFLEACLINIRSSLFTLTKTCYTRERLNISSPLGEEESNKKTLEYLERIQSYEADSNLGVFKFFLENKEGQKLASFKRDEQATISISFDKLSTDTRIYPDNQTHPINYIDSHGYLIINLLKTFSELQKRDKEEELNRFITSFDPTIQNFKVIQEQPFCKIDGEYRHLLEFGDGLLQYIAIICSLYASENGYLFIDEIDNGIHYSHLDRLWEIIFTLSKQTQCQVFATTHSKEMLEAFARVAKKLNEQEISYMTLVRNKQQVVKALVLNDDLLQSSLEQEHEIR